VNHPKRPDWPGTTLERLSFAGVHVAVKDVPAFVWGIERERRRVRAGAMRLLKRDLSRRAINLRAKRSSRYA